MRLLLSTILVFITLSATSAQDQLYMASGDTLSGSIDILFPEEFYEEIVFEANKEKQRMKAHEFVGFMKDGQAYRTIKNANKYRIMMLEKEGYLSLYKFRIDESFAFNGLYAYRIDGQGIEVPTMSFKKTMARLLDDCNAVSLALDEGKYKRKDINQLVDDYNACVNANTAEQMAGRQALMKSYSDVNSEVLIKANTLLNAAKSMNDKELESMMTDVIEKLRGNEEVPSYLKKAIESHAEESSELRDEIMNFLAML